MVVFNYMFLLDEGFYWLDVLEGGRADFNILCVASNIWKTEIVLLETALFNVFTNLNQQFYFGEE